MTVYWPVFFGSAALLFIAAQRRIRRSSIRSATTRSPMSTANSPLELFYFSIETLATVGYGDMHPQTNYGHIVATVEIFTGMCFLAVMTGLIFARFSRPRARFVFADHPVVATRDGQPTLMIRMANARHNTISRATARLWLIRAERTKEGDQLRRFYELQARSQRTSDVHAELDALSRHRQGQPVTRRDRSRACRSRRVAGAQRRRARRQFRAAALCPAHLFAGTISAGSIAIGTSPAFRRRAVFCSTTTSSTTWCRTERRDGAATDGRYHRVPSCPRASGAHLRW